MGDLPIVINYIVGGMLLVVQWTVGALAFGLCFAGIIMFIGKIFGWSTDMNNNRPPR